MRIIAPINIEQRWMAWDRFLSETPEGGFMQSSWWADFRTSAGYDHFAAIVKSNGHIVGGALVHKFTWSDGRAFYYIPEGPVLSSDEHVASEVFRVILHEIDNRRALEQNSVVSHLRIEPRWVRVPPFVTGFRSVPPFNDRFMEPRDSLIVDLRPTLDEILAQMKPKGRYNVRIGQKHGVNVVEDGSWTGANDFIRIYEETAHRQGMDPKPPEYFEELVSLLGYKKTGKLFFAEYHGLRLAAAIVVYFGARATYFFGASSAEYRNVMAPYVLHFEIMRRAKEAGFGSYDFWGIAPRDQVDHPWMDITSFKRKFGGVELNLVPPLDLVYNQSAYADFMNEEGKGERVAGGDLAESHGTLK